MMKCVRCNSELIEKCEKGLVCGTCGKVQETKPVKPEEPKIKPKWSKSK